MVPRMAAEANSRALNFMIAIGVVSTMLDLDNLDFGYFLLRTFAIQRLLAGCHLKICNDNLLEW